MAQSSTAECQKIFERADIDKDASLRDDEAMVYIKALIQAGVTLRDPLVVPYEQFIAECRKGTFANVELAGSKDTEVSQSPDGTVEKLGSGTARDQSTRELPTETSDQDKSSDPTTTNDQVGIINQQSGQQPIADLSSEQALAVPDAIMASILIGANVYSPNNENIAEIKDVIIAEQGGKATHIIVDAGDNNVAVEFSQLKIVTTDHGLKLFMDTTQADLAKLPPVNQ
jgi:sporulation protein YlmC with PRC-barrel domain